MDKVSSIFLIIVLLSGAIANPISSANFENFAEAANDNSAKNNSGNGNSNNSGNGNSNNSGNGNSSNKNSANQSNPSDSSSSDQNDSQDDSSEDSTDGNTTSSGKSEPPGQAKKYEDVVTEQENKKQKDRIVNLENDEGEDEPFDEPITIESTELNEDLSEVTISAWVKPIYDGSAFKMTVISKENSFELFLDNGIKPEHTATFLAFDGVKWLELNSKSSVPENEWSHIAVVINQNQISLYLNGEIQETKFIESGYFNLVDYALPSDDGINTNESQVVIGASEVDGELVNQFSGELGDVIIYDYALTGDEILELFTSTIFENSSDTLGIQNDSLDHGQIEINKPVIWIRNVSFESEVSSSALDLPNDALLMHVHVTTSEGDLVTLYDYATQMSKNIEIIDASKTSEILKTIKQVDKFIVINIDGQDVVYSSMDLNPKLLEDEGITKIIVIDHPAQHVTITFATGVTAQYEEDLSDSDTFTKTVKVSHRSNLHYHDIPVCSEISEELVESGADFRLYWIVDGEEIDVTDDERFDVHFVDSDGNGIDDQMCWTIPQLSEQNFVISADLSIINVQSYPIVDGNWDVKFTTSGTADLVVTGIDGTTFGDSLPDDLKFLSLSNGTHSFDPVIVDNSLTFNDYTSNQESVFSSQVLTEGKHYLEFTYGSDTEIASNSASEMLVDTSLIPLLVSANSKVTTCQSPTELAVLSTGFEEPGIHNIIASTLFNRQPTDTTTVNVWLEDHHGTVLAQNKMEILLNNNDRSNGYVLIAQNQNGEVNAAYVVKACTTSSGVLGEAKITAFDGLERTTFEDGGLWDQSKSGSPLVSVETTYPAGDNVILVSVQVDSAVDQVIPEKSV